MAIWIDRKKAALARMHSRPTPRSQLRAMAAQMAEQQDLEAEMAKLVEKGDKAKPLEKVRPKPLAKPKSKREAKAMKKQKPKIQKPKEEVNYGEHGHDFFSEERQQ